MKRLITGLAGIAIAGLSLTACGSSGGGSSGGSSSSSMYSAGDLQACQDMASIPAVSTNGQDEGTIQDAANAATSKQLVSDLTVVFGEINGQMYAGESTVEAAENQVTSDCAAVNADKSLPSSITYQMANPSQQPAAQAAPAYQPQPESSAQASAAAQQIASQQAQAAAQASQAAAQASQQAAAQQSQAAAQQSAAAQASAAAVQSAAAQRSQGAAENAAVIAAENKSMWEGLVEQDWVGHGDNPFTVPNNPADTGAHVTVTCTTSGSGGNLEVSCTGGGVSFQFDY